MTNKVKFAASYSGGKDSVFALYKAMQAGYSPAGLLTTFNKAENSSWFHGVSQETLESAASALGLPLFLVDTSGENYVTRFESTLLNFKENGVDACVFGDIDIEEHLKWCEERCKNIGLSAIFPLWKLHRRELVHEFISAGFKAKITVVNTEKISEKYLGLDLDVETTRMMESDGIDICGESGEFHTFVYDGPIFSCKVDITRTGIHRAQSRSILTF